MKRLVILGLAMTGMLLATVPFREGPYVGPVNPLLMQNDTTDPLKLRFNYLFEFAQIAQFCADWQLDDADSVDHGGMIEAETGELADVIQTDNTQEAIWVWCRYAELTGNTERFRENIEKAWFYCENFPAWEEEGNPGDDYYRAHNCAWGLAAEQRYRAVYGDDSYGWYRDSCSRYIMNHPLLIYIKRNRFVTGWCAGWLYIYADEMEDSEAMDTALVRGDALIDWVESMTPEYGLIEEGWAMSSGTLVWGICNSSLTDDTIRGKEWIAANGPYLDTFQEWRNLDYYSWDNSWNVGFANGHGAMYKISHDETYARHHKWLTHKLLSYDTDNDGGIMATTQDADTTDMTWVSLYLCMMGLDPLIGEVFDRDAGALEIVGLHDGDQIEPGATTDLKAVVSNYGREALAGIEVKLEGDASGSGTASVEFLGADTVLLASDWMVTDSATLIINISHPDDENPDNDTCVVRLNKAAVEEEIAETPVTEPSLYLEIASLSGPEFRISYDLPSATPPTLEIFDVSGTLVKQDQLTKSSGELILNLEELPRGVYFTKLVSEGEYAIKRFVLIY